jgi:enamine deaminase RidA (YjgF/YER057c/UK114 family)
MSIKRIDTNKLMSKAVISGNTVYLSGLTANDRSQDVKGQCKQILDTVDDYLAQAGTDKSKILVAQIWLTDIGTWADMNEVWVAWIDPANPPARATVEAKLAVPDLYIEIMVTAAL